ncbi:MAG: hypothetical protein HQM11_00425 [SAR324 cluster bacterium]|nr:hypothetical protein [SAR324 cluster bacterium]
MTSRQSNGGTIPERAYLLNSLLGIGSCLFLSRIILRLTNNHHAGLFAGTLMKDDMVTLLQDAVNRVMPAIRDDPFCENKVALNVLQIAASVPVTLDHEWFRKTFSSCERFVPLLH